MRFLFNRRSFEVNDRFMNQLKKYLMINSAFSLLSGLLLTFASSSINTLFGISNKIVLPIIGINLLIFSLMVYYVAVKQLKNKSLVSLITSLDLLWVIGSLALLIFQWFNLTSIGYIVVGCVAIWIAYLGAMQFKFNKT